MGARRDTGVDGKKIENTIKLIIKMIRENTKS